MPWTIAVHLDSDKVVDENSVGTVTATYTDGVMFPDSNPFAFSTRSVFHSADVAQAKPILQAALSNEIAKRTLEDKIKGILETAVNS